MSEISKTLFIGSKQLGLSCLQAICSVSRDTIIGVVTIDDSKDSRSVLKDYISFCDDNNIKLFVAKNKKDTETIIIAEQPELCLVIGWYWLFSKSILDFVPNGFIGLHNSLLPKYRGGSPLIWNVINGEKTVGFSLFSFGEGMDDGVVWHQYKYDPDPAAPISDILGHLELAATEVLKKCYIPLLHGEITGQEQDHSLASYCAQRIPADGVINWRDSADSVFNFIRAQSAPYPGAYTYLENEKLTIWSVELDNRLFYGTPGQVAAIDGNGVYIMCGDHKCIILKEIEWREQKGASISIIKSINIRLN